MYFPSPTHPAISPTRAGEEDIGPGDLLQSKFNRTEMCAPHIPDPLPSISAAHPRPTTAHARALTHTKGKRKINKKVEIFLLAKRYFTHYQFRELSPWEKRRKQRNKWKEQFKGGNFSSRRRKNSFAGASIK